AQLGSVAGTARYRSLLQVTERLSTSFDRAALQQTVVEAAEALSGADAVLLRMARGDLLEPIAWAGIDAATAKQIPAFPLAEAWRAEILAAGRAWSCDDVRQLPPGSALDRFAAHPTVRGVLFLPLIHGGRVIGSLSVATLEPRPWTDEDLEIMTALGAHSALALRNAELFERLEARAAQMAVVQAASARMNRAKTVDSVGRVIVEEVGKIVDYHNARVYLVEGNDALAPIAVEGTVGEYRIVDWNVLRVKIGEGFTGWVAEHGTAVRISDANSDPRGVQIPGTHPIQESLLVVPMHHDESVIGVITLSKLGLNQFDEDDLQVLTILADQAATALESARLLSRTESMAVELRRLLEMSSELSQTLDPRQVGALIARHLTVALGVDACAISSWDVAGDRLVSLGGYPDRGLLAYQPAYLLSEYPETRRVLETKRTVTIDTTDPTADPAEVAILRQRGHRLLWMVPLIAKGQSVGLVELMSGDSMPLDEGRLALARTMANEAAMALENAQLYEAARSLADRDPLTGFFNHRALYERLGEEFVRARRARRPLSLLMLDIDDFKLVNDTFGHQFGDRCLVHLADVVRSVLRLSDVPARYGGDEFAVILPEADAAAAAAIAARITEELARSPLIADGRGPVPIGVSIGAASIGPEIRTPTDLVGAADAELYVAKGEVDSGAEDRLAEDPRAEDPGPGATIQG
ncbi:MAG TPA: GAF domain-containing protein, partial [Candidatus Sulfomarinibacteraceae bacterium]|nr:GAF domain-containing protein [Candidatus Sulfomarinibacteraceae bacterium]